MTDKAKSVVNKGKLNGNSQCVTLKVICRAKPFLKWPGGKRALLPEIRQLMPKNFRRYIEPFVGGGALFFDTCPENAVLADHNEDLVKCYVAVRDNVDAVIDHLNSMNNTAEEYYRIRKANPGDLAERAARLIYLATLSFNGIYRVNLRGEFNVPYGYKVHLNPCNKDALIAASSALANATVISGDFDETVKDAAEKDFIYLDPPYTVAHTNNGFIKYNAHIFSWEDQIRLASTAKRLADKGCYVMVSNANYPDIIELYKDFEAHTVYRPSRIAASSDYRGRVSECLFTSWVYK